MRPIATTLTILGILLHALLGWCPQHEHAVCSHGAKTVDPSAKQTCCHHHSHSAPPTPAKDHSETPTDSDHSPCCDHADCLFLDGSVAGQKICVPDLPLLQFVIVELTSFQIAQQPAGAAAPLFEPPSRAQAARMARCVWLI